MSNVTLLGTTTLRRMVSAIFDENDTLHNRYTFGECFVASIRVERNPKVGDEVVYVYYHRKRNETIMTNIKDDFVGAMGSSAGFEGKLKKSEFAE